MKKQFRKDVWLGFLGFLGFRGIPELLTQDWFEAMWIFFFAFFVYFIPVKKKS